MLSMSAALKTTGRYLRGSDLTPIGQRRIAIIKAVELREVRNPDDRDGPTITKGCLSFESRSGQPWEKEYLLNPTNTLVLINAYGDDGHQWIGKPIEIWAENMIVRGAMTQGIRISIPSRLPDTAQRPPPMSMSGAGGLPPVATPASPPASVWKAPSADEAPEIIDDEIPF